MNNRIMPLSVGDTLGPYEILSQIAAGGMGVVYKARDTRLDRMVALKVSTEQYSERFGREARAVAALNHPNICQIYDVGPDFIVLEFVNGHPLLSPAEPGPLPLKRALEYAGQICDALEALHQRGTVHRDPQADILTCGVVLYEMLSAWKAFRGESAIWILAAILRIDPPPLTEAPSEVARG